MLTLDHLTVIAPSLAEGVEHVRASLDMDIPYGGSHPQMGTHNHLLRLSDSVFLEVIAIDPSAPRPNRARWFGLDAQQRLRDAWDAGRRLSGWVARIEAQGEVPGEVRGQAFDKILTEHGALLGQAVTVSRGERSWRFAVRDDGELPMSGIAPCVIDWGERGTPAPHMPELGVALHSFTLEHPSPEIPHQLYRSLGIQNAPVVVQAHAVKYRAVLRTPNGLRELL